MYLPSSACHVAQVIQYNQQDHIISEKTILAEIDHPFVIQVTPCNPATITGCDAATLHP